MRLITLILSTSFVIYANGEGHVYYSSHGFPRPYGQQFQSWLPKYHHVLHNISTGKCNATLHDYRNAYASERNSLQASQLLSICYQHEACILDELQADQIANFQAASVLLGLLPTLLSTIGPSVSEIALLSAHRPILSFFISMGAPAIYPTRIFEYNDPGRILAEVDNMGNAGKLTIGKRAPLTAALLSIIEYVMALVAAGLVMFTSIDLSQKSILAWGCTANFLPVLWTSLASIVHIVAAASYFVVKLQSHRLREKDKSGDLAIQEPLMDRGGRVQTKHETVKKGYNFAWAFKLIQRETKICANRKIHKDENDFEVPRTAVLLNIAAGCCGFVHVVLGTIVLSSMQLVSVSDVLNQVLWRWIISTVVCRLILIFELAGLRTAKQSGNQKQEPIRAMRSE